MNEPYFKDGDNKFSLNDVLSSILEHEPYIEKKEKYR